MHPNTRHIIDLELPPIPVAEPLPEVDGNVAWFRGRMVDDGPSVPDADLVVRARPGEGPGGTCAVDVISRTTSFVAAIAAARLLNGVANFELRAKERGWPTGQAFEVCPEGIRLREGD